MVQSAINRYISSRMFIQNCSLISPDVQDLFFETSINNNNKSKKFIGNLKSLILKFNTNQCVDDQHHYPSFGDNELYYLNVEINNKAEIVSETIWGILR